MAKKTPAYVSTTRETARRCPSCNRINDAATHVDLNGTSRGLAIGDVGVCAYCSAVIVVTADGFALGTLEDVDGLDDRLRRLVLEYVPPGRGEGRH